MAPSLPLGLRIELSSDDLAVSNDRLDYLREKIEELLHREESVILPRKGKTARESSIVQLELFDDLTGEMIFG